MKPGYVILCLLGTLVAVFLVVVLVYWAAMCRPVNIPVSQISRSNPSQNRSHKAPTRILTWNTQLLPWPASHGASARARRIIQAPIFDGADLVVLTEVVHPKAAEIVLNGLAQRGFVWITRPLQATARANGGLVMASRSVPLQTSHDVFRHATHAEGNRLIAKGFVVATWKNKKEYPQERPNQEHKEEPRPKTKTFIALHLESCANGVETRKLQLNQIREHIAKLKNIHSSWLVGDFNFDLRKEAEWYGLTNLPLQSGTTWQNWCIDGALPLQENKDKGNQKGNAKKHKAIHKVFREHQHSDHCPVLSILE